MNSASTFSTARKWSHSLNVAISILSALAIVVMVNYVAARHFKRISVSSHSPVELSPFTQRVLSTLTNELKVTLYFDKDDALYEPSEALLKEYKFANSKITLETVDYIRDPTAASLIKTKYKLSLNTDKNQIIFDCSGRPPRIVHDSELSELDLKPLMSGQSREVRRKSFKGELAFTSAILAVLNPQPLKAYFLQGHGEHQPEGEDPVMGYSKFASILRESNIKWEILSLLGNTEIPPDCQLLIIAGPTNPLLNEELDKIDHYLSQGGRLLVMFPSAISTSSRQLGLEKLVAAWGVQVGFDVVLDAKSSVAGQRNMIVQNFGSHPLIRSLYRFKLQMSYPRSVRKMSSASNAADAPKVEVLAKTGPEGQVVTDIRKGGEAYSHPGSDYVGEVPLMVAMEKGTIRGVNPDRGSTRMVVVGEALFLGNGLIEAFANSDFLTHSVNWLLARNELLVPLAPRPIKEYKLAMSSSQLQAVRWILMLGFPGSVLLVGLLVSVRRRK